MSAPTLAQVRTVVVAWWREPGRPVLAVLRARIAKLWNDPNTSVRLSLVNNAGVWSVVAQLETRDANGVVVSTVNRVWTPTSDDMQARIEKVADVVDDLGTSPAERAAMAAAGAEVTP